MTSNGSISSSGLSDSSSSWWISNNDISSNRDTINNNIGQSVFDTSNNTNIFIPISETSFGILPILSGISPSSSPPRSLSPRSSLSSSILVLDASVNISNNFSITDISCNTDSSFSVPPIVDVNTTTITDGSGYNIIYTQGNTADGNFEINVGFTTTDPSFNHQITENLTEIFTVYDDETEQSQSSILLNQIQQYANEIKCSQFHGKGTIDDYTELFVAASKIANESKQMELNINIEGFSEFANAADDLSNLFNGFIIKLQNVNIINDISFLQSIVNALAKIVNLSKVFGRFKEIVFATTTINIPKSTHDTAVILQGVMQEINCAVEHIQYFVSSSDISLNDAQLSHAEKNMILKSVDTINHWNELCNNGINISMSNNPDIQYIQQASNQLKNTTNTLTNATSRLKSKLAAFAIRC